MGGSGPAIETGAANLMNPAWAFTFLKNSTRFSKIANKLDILRDAQFYANFDWDTPYWPFYHVELPTSVYYFISYFGANTNVGLKVTDRAWLTPGLAELFRTMAEAFPTDKKNKKLLLAADCYELSIYRYEPYLNAGLNFLINFSLKPLLAIHSGFSQTVACKAVERP